MSVEFGVHSVAGQNIAGLQRALVRQTLRFTVTSTRINKRLCQCPAHVKAFEKLCGEQPDADHQQGSHDVECFSEFPEPAFRKVEIHSTQAIERQEIVPHGPIVATVPCRADSAGVGIDYRHFINGENVTSAATQATLVHVWDFEDRAY
ncbi:hypothetical protein BGX21_004501 [Mortierella sp. AD011]|nr:hypothetical protein BGX20_000369 [Mortierella sp. AD010]KAF9400354.1 hypothetical protein BGX21_004501 [Mortierella sp. AD011]